MHTQVPSPITPIDPVPKEPTITIIEDDPECANILRIYLCEAGFHVNVAHDGVSGLELVGWDKSFYE